MKLGEVIKLAAAGYGVQEIREISELSGTNPEVIELANGRKMEEIRELMKLADPESEKLADPESKKKEQKKDQDGGENDRKADPEIEKIKAENEKLKEDLKKAQKANAAKPSKEEEGDTPEDVLVDMMLNL